MSRNLYAEIGRAKKVDKITEAIDRVVMGQGRQVYSPRVIAAVLRTLRDKSDTDWASFAARNGIKPPSKETVALVVEHFVARLAHVEASRLEPKGVELEEAS